MEKAVAIEAVLSSCRTLRRVIKKLHAIPEARIKFVMQLTAMNILSCKLQSIVHAPGFALPPKISV